MKPYHSMDYPLPLPKISKICWKNISSTRSSISSLFSQNIDPPSWEIAIILSFLKTNLGPTFPSHTIARTGVFGKLIQKIFNKRFFSLLESRNHSQALADLHQSTILPISTPAYILSFLTSMKPFLVSGDNIYYTVKCMIWTFKEPPKNFVKLSL